MDIIDPMSQALPDSYIWGILKTSLKKKNEYLFSLWLKVMRFKQKLKWRNSFICKKVK